MCDGRPTFALGPAIEVGTELGISDMTVKARGKMMRKMKVDSLPDLFTMAAKLGLAAAPTD